MKLSTRRRPGLNFKNLQNSLKHCTDLNADADADANTLLTHIIILELHTLALISPSGNLMPNINKQNIKRNEIVLF